MMKKLLLACIVTSLFIGCSKKDILKWINKPGNPKPSVPCKIDSIYPVGITDPLLHASTAVGIHYNSQGYPTLLNYSVEGFTLYLPKFSVYYKYDSKNRLIEVDPPYVDPVTLELESLSPVLPHKFVYQGNSILPIRDSILSDTFSGVSEGVAYKVYTVKVEDLFYDAQGRANRVVTRREFHNTLSSDVNYYTQEVKFSYDANGNRSEVFNSSGATASPVSYTNKPSLFSLHPVWQLLHKNWSKNSAIESVQTYNSYGLPTKADLKSTGFLQTKNLNSENPFSYITYTCY